VDTESLRSALRQGPVEGALALLGCELLCGGVRARIVEVEAYDEGDPASHSFRGCTERNSPMFGEPGHSYVYFTYGMHWCLNVVAGEPGRGAAVLIRAAIPLEGLELMRVRRPAAKREKELLAGPARLTASFALDGSHNGLPLLGEIEPRIEPGLAPTRILQGVRVGLAPGKGDETLWRFVDAEAQAWVSRPRSGLSDRA